MRSPGGEPARPDPGSRGDNKGEGPWLWGFVPGVPSRRDRSSPELRLLAGRAGGPGGGRRGRAGCALRSALAPPPPPPHTLRERERGADGEPPGPLRPEPAGAGARTAAPARAVRSRSPDRGPRRRMDGGAGGRRCLETGKDLAAAAAAVPGRERP